MEYFDFLLEQDLQRLAVVDAARSGCICEYGSSSSLQGV